MAEKENSGFFNVMFAITTSTNALAGQMKWEEGFVEIRKAYLCFVIFSSWQKWLKNLA